MARHARGWTLRRRVAGGVYYVRFSHGGRLVERSTGTRDRIEAEKAAARIYAATVQTTPLRRATRGAGGPLEELIGKWLSSLSSTHDAGTLATWEMYAAAHWLPRWVTSTDLTTEAMFAYRDERLRSVLASTVRKESTALRSFIAWLTIPVTVPSIPKRVVGTPYKLRRRKAAPEVAPAEAKRFFAALPEWSKSRRVARFPIRARFVVGYETTLRPSTLDRLRAPEHYRRGSATILLTAAADKARFGREIPLTDAVRKALDAVCPDEGLIFGKHDYREHVAAAAAKAFPPEVAERFAGTHLRSAGITHLLERSGNLPGTQYMAGHKLVSSTARYAKPSLRAARDALGLGAPKNPRKRARPAKRRSG